MAIENFKLTMYFLAQHSIPAELACLSHHPPAQSTYTTDPGYGWAFAFIPGFSMLLLPSKLPLFETHMLKRGRFSNENGQKGNLLKEKAYTEETRLCFARFSL